MHGQLWYLAQGGLETPAELDHGADPPFEQVEVAERVAPHGPMLSLRPGSGARNSCA